MRSSMVEHLAVNQAVVGSSPTASVIIIIMKKLLYIISFISICFFISGCYSTKSMGDSEKADKYLFIY